MTFFSIFIALLIERLAPQFSELRQFQWLREYNQWLKDVLHTDRLGGWLGFSIVILPLMVVAWMLSAMFDNALFGLFELAFGVLVVFFCLGPKVMDGQIDRYLDAIELDDIQQRNQLASQLMQESPEQELSVQVGQVSKGIFVEANTRLFAILFWFSLLGPVAAVLYRIIEQLLRGNMLDDTLTETRQVVRRCLGILDWLPARISLFAFMVSGSFEEALQAYRRGTVTATDWYEQNQELLKNVGYQSIAAHTAEDKVQAIAVVRKSRGLVLRSLVVWLLIVLVISVTS